METNPSELEAAGESGDGEPDRLNPGGEKARGMNRAHGSTSQALPPLALECSTFRRTVWAHMDPCRRKRLNLEDFEERLNVVPSTADKVVHQYLLRLRSLAEATGTESEQAKRLFRVLDLNKTGEVTFVELWTSALQLGLVRSNFVDTRDGRRYLFAERSLGCISMSNRIRQQAVRLMVDRRFGGFILSAIMANSVFMALEDDKDPGKLDGNPNVRNQIVIFSDMFFLGVFTCEILIKAIAMGMVANERCYLREGWNRLDMVIVCSGLAAYVPGIAGGSLTVLRVFRILRPLRSLRATPTLRKIVEALLGSIPGIINVLIFQTMFFVLFALLGLQLWAGLTLYECRETALPAEDGTWETYTDDPRACSPGTFGLFHCDTDAATLDRYPFCASPSDLPSDASWDNPQWRQPELNYGISNFDNIGVALLTVFQCVTMEGWVGIMNMYRDGYSSTFSAIYFLVLVGFGAFFMINLFFAVMWEQFSAIADIESRKVDPDDPQIFRRFGTKRLSIVFDKIKKVTPLELVGHPETPQTPGPRRSLVRSTLREMARTLVESHVFQATIVLCIVFNTFLLCLDSYPEDPDLVHVAEVANFYLTLIFAVEMTLMIWALGPRGYVADRFNVFDGIIVLFSIAELLLSALGSVQGLGGIVSSLRFFRLLRVLKLAKSWKSMRRILTTAGNSLHEMGHIIALLALFIYIFALEGMKLFSSKFWFEEGGAPVPWHEVIRLNSTERVLEGIYQPRVNFDSFGSSLLACFIIITGEDWNQVMYDGIRGGGSYWYSTFFVACVGLGQFVALNLFLAVLLSNIDTSDKTEIRGKQRTPVSLLRERWKRLGVLRTMVRLWPKPRPPPAQVSEPETRGEWGVGPPVHEEEPHCGSDQNLLRADPASDEQRGGEEVRPNELAAAAAAAGESGRDGPAGRTGRRRRRFWQCPLCWGRARERCGRVVRSHRFEVGTMALVFASSITLVLQSPLDDPSMTKTAVLTVIDLSMTFIFSCEMILKIFAMGSSYFKDEWNVMDGAIVVISATADVLGLLSVRGNAFSSLRVLRALRALRLLRLIPRAPGLKRVVNAMIRGLPPVLNVAVVVLVFFLIFSILGVRLFKGTFVGCDFSGLGTATLVEAMREFGLSRETYVKPFRESDCLAAGGVWRATVDQNFDNVASGLLSLFEIATTEGWVRVMQAGVDSVGIGINPVEGWNSWMTIFFIGVIIVGNFFATNLFVGAVIETYQALSNEDASFLMTDAQRSWVELQKMASLASLKPTPRRPAGKLRGWAFDLVERPSFERVAMAFIITYTLILMLHHLGEPDAVSRLIEVSSTVFTVAFAVELLLKAAAYGFVKMLKRSPADVYDFAVVAVALVALFLELLYGISFGALASTARVTRVLLVFKVMRGAHALQELMEMLTANLFGMLNISALLLLIMCCYAVVGINLFATVALQTELSVHSNFQNFKQALITLFRYTTGEAWNTAMHELFLSPAAGDGTDMPVGTSCVESPTYEEMSNAWEAMGTTTHMIGCGPHRAFTIAFFLSYIMLSSFILINIFVAIIVDSVAAHYKARELKLADFQLRILCEEWSKLDQDATYLVPVQLFPLLWQKVQVPLGLPAWEIPRRVHERRNWVASLGIHNYDGNVYFYEVLNVLTLKVVERGLLEDITAKQRRERRMGKASTYAKQPSSQAQAAAILEEEIFKSSQMEKHSMFQAIQVCAKGAEVRAARSAHNLEQVMAAAHVQHIWRAYYKRRIAEAGREITEYGQPLAHDAQIGAACMPL